MFELEYEFREQDLVYFNELQLEHSKEIQDSIRKNRLIVPGVMMLVAAFYYFYYQELASAGYIAFVAALWGMLSPRVMKLDFRRQILSKYTYAEKSKMFGTFHLSLDKDFLSEKSPGGKHKTPWSEVIRVERHPEYDFIFVGLTTALVIPKETIKQGNLDEFITQVVKMIEHAE